MKTVAIWGTSIFVFVIIRVLLSYVGVFSQGERVGGVLDFFIFFMLLSLFQFVYGFIFKDKSQATGEIDNSVSDDYKQENPNKIGE